jgi:hypothetical protein
MAFRLPVDIANRALQHLGKPNIYSFTDESDEAHTMGAAYDNLRLDELSSNLWRFATKRVILRNVTIDSVLWTPPTWAAGTFSVGSIVAYTPGNGVYNGVPGYWQTSVAKTGSNTTTPDNDADWRHYNGPVAFDLYDAETTYFAGEIVLVPSAWGVGTTYAANAVVRSGTTWYVSLAGSNVGNAVSDTDWWTPWSAGGRDSGTWGLTAGDSPIPLTYPGTVGVYLSLYNGNDDNPVSATGNWLSLTGTVAAIGSVGAADIRASNMFRLPVGFLKRAPTWPKGNIVPYLGAASGVPPEDWQPEGDYIVSTDTGPVMLRFVADVTDVAAMSPQFCEGLAARLATELAGSLGAADKQQSAERAYRRTMMRARVSNSIEVGPIAMVENRYITVRQ